MPRPQKDPLRRLTAAERRELGHLRRSCTAPAAEATRAALIRLVSDGYSYQAAARAVGRRSGDAVAHLVARFDKEGLAAITPRHGGGRVPTYDTAARDRILREVARPPTPGRDGTATWSLSILRRVLRSAPDGLPRVSTFTIWRVLREAGYSFPRTRTRGPTGRAVRRRKEGADPPAGRVAGAAGAGQPGRAPDARAGAVAVRPRGHAGVHPAGRLPAEHGREHSADPEGPGAGRAGADPPRPDHRLVRVGVRPLECRPDAVRMGRPAGGAEATARSPASGGRFGGANAAADLPTV